MNNKNLIILAGSLSVLGCAVYESTGDDWKDSCASRRQILIKVKHAGIEVSPANACAHAGESLPVRIQRRKHKANTVHSSEKPHPEGGVRAHWLNRSNDNAEKPDEFTFDVPAGDKLEALCEDKKAARCRFEYEIRVNDVGVIDPMITVIR